MIIAALLYIQKVTNTTRSAEPAGKSEQQRAYPAGKQIPITTPFSDPWSVLRREDKIRRSVRADRTCRPWYWRRRT